MLSVSGLDLARFPSVIAWELTRACAYHCAHCRADSQPYRDPDELDTSEALALVDDLAGFETRPNLVLTGGDPLARRDVFEIAAHAGRRGLRVALTPTATPLTTPARMIEARSVGIRNVAFSLDAPEAPLHDRFRGLAGSFERTLAGIEAAAEAGLSVQVNTTVCVLNGGVIEQMVQFLSGLGIARWSVSFLVPTGRVGRSTMLSPWGHEWLIHWLVAAAPTLPFDVEVGAAPQHRRIAREQRGSSPPVVADRSSAACSGPSPETFNDGRGLMFVSHRGEVMPSGFLPISAGLVWEDGPVRIYREAPLFRQLRNPAALRGKCGRCEFRELCGGSRARAYAVTGNPMESDPSCPYRPSSASESDPSSSRATASGGGPPDTP